MATQRRKIDTWREKIGDRCFDLTVYLCQDSTFEIDDTESSMRLKGSNLRTMKADARAHLEKYVGVVWIPFLLIEYECGEGFGDGWRKIEFHWEPILVRPKYNKDKENYYAGLDEEEIGVYRTNDGSNHRHVRSLGLCCEPDKIRAVVGDTEQNRVALINITNAIEDIGLKIRDLLKPDNLQATLSGKVQKLLKG
jgi:hypothetical protein